MQDKTIGPFQHKLKNQFNEMERGISMMRSEVLNNVQLFNTWLSLMAEPENLKEWVRIENEKTK